jgi:hypothetical protein
MNLTSTYPFDSMSVGDSFTVIGRFQHARVAASEYARKHSQCYTCRMQPDGTMKIFRCEANQIPVDQRGRRGRRRIVQAVNEPSSIQFGEWLATFAVGQSYNMPASYAHLFTAMIAWCELYSLRSGRNVRAERNGDTLVITRHN